MKKTIAKKPLVLPDLVPRPSAGPGPRLSPNGLPLKHARYKFVVGGEEGSSAEPQFGSGIDALKGVG